MKVLCLLFCGLHERGRPEGRPPGSSQRGEAGGDALADRLAPRFETPADGHDDLQAVLPDPARIRRPSRRQCRSAVPYRHLDQSPDDTQVQQDRTRRVLKGVGDQLADHQLRHVQGASGDGRAKLGLHPGEEADSPMAGTGDVRPVTVQRHRVCSSCPHGRVPRTAS
ncbi:hypothetical protein GCM10010293_49920 [Streptomyces griseoflavus]|nr:hypothetical protein GCM10010293_49920 [Streptomyces griseoflavus]